MVKFNTVAAPAALAVFLGLAGPAQAQELRGTSYGPQSAPVMVQACDPVATPCEPGTLNDVVQVQDGAVTATTVVAPPPGGGPIDAISASAISLGNNLTATAQGVTGVTGNATQRLNAPVTAITSVFVADPVTNALVANANAAGNTAQASACCGGIDIDLTQIVSPLATEVRAEVDVTTGPGLGSLAASAAASANTIGAAVVNGPMTVNAAQSSAATVFSRADSTVCCSTGSITLGSTAVANALNTESTTSTVYVTANQSSTGNVLGRSTHWTNSGDIITAATQATANSVAVYNQWGYTQVDGTQTNSGAIEAVGALTAHNYGLRATAGAAATANSALVSSTGSDGTIGLTQINDLTGGVSAVATFDALSATGGVGVAQANAIGNAITGYACSSCGQDMVKFEGYTSQTNSGSVTANVTMSGSGVVLSGTATAVGNTANFLVQQRGGN